MDLEKIFSLMHRAEKSSFSKVEIQTEDLKICLEKQITVAAAPIMTQAAEETVKAPEEKKKKPKNDDLLLAPISGVFYAAKEPGATPFVREGQQVRKGDPVCIIEAMKLMNELTADMDGEVVDVCVNNGDVVEYGQPLFKLC